MSAAQNLITEAINAWPQFDNDEEVSGADLVEWFGEWRARAKAVKPTKVLVVVEGGCVHDVFADCPLDIVVVDYDAAKSGDHDIDTDTLEARSIAFAKEHGLIQQGLGNLITQPYTPQPEKIPYACLPEDTQIHVVTRDEWDAWNRDEQIEFLQSHVHSLREAAAAALALLERSVNS